MIPVGCKVRQIAVQIRKAGVSQIQVNRDLYDRLDEVNKAAFWMHEGIYSEAIDTGHTNSIGTRNLNGVLLTTKFLTGRTKYETMGNNAYLLTGARWRNGFLSVKTSANGDTVFLKEDIACGFALNSGLTVPCKEPIKYNFKDAKLEYVEFSSPFQGFGLKVPVKKLYFYEPKAELAAAIPVTFDGHVFQCLPGETIEFSPYTFSAGEGYAGTTLITKCLGSYAGSVLPAHFTSKLFNEEPFYRIQFDYVFNRTGTHPAGIKYSRKNGKWNLGFTPFESLDFNSYQEHWYASQIWMKNVTGHFSTEKRHNGVECELAGGNAKVLLRDGTPYLMQAKITPMHDQSCVYKTAFGEPTEPSNKLNLIKFKRDTSGRIYWGIAKECFPLPMGGSKTPEDNIYLEAAEFRGPVEIRNGRVVKGRVCYDRSLNIKLNGKHQRLQLWAGKLYEFTESGARVVSENESQN